MLGGSQMSFRHNDERRQSLHGQQANPSASKYLRARQAALFAFGLAVGARLYGHPQTQRHPFGLCATHAADLLVCIRIAFARYFLKHSIDCANVKVNVLV